MVGTADTVLVRGVLNLKCPLWRGSTVCVCAIHMSHRLCGDDVFLFAAVEPAHPLDGHVVGLGGSTCEEYLPRVSANQTGYLLQGGRGEVRGGEGEREGICLFRGMGDRAT